MNKLQKARLVSLTTIAGRIAIATALIWTVALLGGGLRRILHRPLVQLSAPLSPTAETFSQVQNVPSGLFSYGGSNTWAPIRLKVDSAIQSERLGFQLRFVQPNTALANSGTAMQMLIDDQLSLVQLDRPITPAEYLQAKQRGFKLKQIPVAIDGIAIAVNPTLNLPGLTLAELKGIYTGEILNWRSLGGPDLAITLFSSPKNDGTVQFFRNDVLGKKAFAPNIAIISTTTQAIRRLSQTPGGIYYASASTLVPQCSIETVPIGRNGSRFINPQKEPVVKTTGCLERRHQVNLEAFRSGQYPISRYLYVVIKENKQIDARAGNAYADFLLTNQGQDAIGKAGFVRIR